VTQSVGPFQFVGLTSSRLVRYAFPDEASGTTDLTLKGDLAESWQASSDQRVWVFKLRQGVKWHNIPPLNGRELVAADVKYCFEAYAKEGVQSFTFREIEGMETPDKYTLRVHLQTPNVLFPQNVAESVTVIFPREVLEEDGDLKKRLIGTGPYILKEHTRKVRVVLTRNPDYYDKGRPYVDEYVILSAPDAATRLAAFRTGQSDILAVASVSEAEDRPQDEPRGRGAGDEECADAVRLALAQDRPPLTTCGCGAPSPWPSTARSRWTRCTRATACSAGASRTSTTRTPCRRPPSSAPGGSTVRRRRRSSSRKRATRTGFETTLFYYEYFPQMTSQVQIVPARVAEELNINVKITKLDYTTYYGPLRRGQVGRDGLGVPVGPRGGPRRADVPYMHSKSRRTSSGQRFL